MGETPVPEQVARVKDIIDASPSISKTTSEQEAVKVRAEMRELKRGMEGARGRLGNFCVTIGNDEGGVRSEAVVLVSPVAGTGNYGEFMHYVVITDSGVKAVRFFPGDLENNPNYKSSKAALGNLRQAISTAVAGNGVITGNKDCGYKKAESWGDKQIVYGEDSLDAIGEIVGVEGNNPLLDEAVKASIALVREQNQALLDKTSQTLAPTAIVKEQLGIKSTGGGSVEASKPSPPPAPRPPIKSWFGFKR